MTVPEILFLTAHPRRLGHDAPLPVRVCSRDGQGWALLPAEAESPPPEEALTLDLGRDLADFWAFPEFEAAMDAWWAGLGLREEATVVLVLPFACTPHAAARVRSWARKRLRRPLLVVAEALLPVLEALPALTSWAEPTEVLLSGPGRNLHVQASRGRVVILGREGTATARVEVGEPGHHLVEALRRGPEQPVRIGLRATWSLVEAGNRRPLFSARPEGRTWQHSVHVKPGPDLGVVCSLGSAPADRSRLARVRTPRDQPARIDLWLDARVGRVRALVPGGEAPGFSAFPLPVLVS